MPDPEVPVLIRLTAGGAAVEDAADLRRLSVVAADGHDATALGPLGRAADDDHVWLDVAELERAAAAALPAGADVDAWRAGYAGMLAYAGGQGWLDGDGTHVRAHVERPSSEQM